MTKHLLALCLAALSSVSIAPAQDSRPAATAESTVIAINEWPIDGCVVSGKPLVGGKAKTFEVEGTTFKTCCGKCQKKVEANPTKYAERVHKAIAAAQRETYPLETCPISDKPLGKSTREVIVDGMLVKVCCKKCAAKAPAKAKTLAEVVRRARVADQLAGYKATTCPVSGEELDADDAIDVMYGGTLVRFCCEDCVDDFKKEPQKYMAKLAAHDGDHGEAHEKAGHDDRDGHGDGGEHKSKL